MPVAKIGRRTYWEIAAAAFLLWTTYVALDIWAGFPDIPRGVAAVFIVVEFTLISCGLRREDRTKEFMTVLEANNAMLADTLDRAVKHAQATAYTDSTTKPQSRPRRKPRPGQPPPKVQASPDAAYLADMAESVRLGREIERREQQGPQAV